MKLLFGTQVPLDRSHGGTRHVLAVTRELTRLGHQVTLLAPGQESHPVEGVRRLRPFPTLQPGLRMDAALAAMATAENLRHRPDVAYVRLSATTMLLPRVLSLRGVPVVLELNGRILEELRRLGRSELAVRLVQAHLRPVVKQAASLVAVEPNIGAHAETELGARNVHVILNGADIDVATPGSREPARARLGLPSGRPIVAFAGSLVPELRLDLLLGAVRTADVSLVVAGDGPRAETLRAAAQQDPERIRWLGSVPHQDAVTLLRAANVCVNVRDGDLGMKALEYAAIGRRMVVFDVPGSERLDGLYPGLDAVFRVGVRSSEALADAILRALNAERSRGPLPADRIASARHAVSWSRTAEQIASVLEDARRSTATRHPR